MPVHILNNSVTGYIQINFIKQIRRSRAVPLVHVKFIPMHQIANIFTYGRVTIG